MYFLKKRVSIKCTMYAIVQYLEGLKHKKKGLGYSNLFNIIV